MLLGIQEHGLEQICNTEVVVLKVSGKLLTPEHLPYIADQIRDLVDQGKKPIVVVGGGIQYDAIPGYGNAQKVNGIRVTSLELMDQITQYAAENQGVVVNALQKAGMNSDAFPFSTLQVEKYGCETDQETGKKVETQYVGKVTGVNIENLTHAIEEGYIPVISHVGSTEDVPYNINATHAASAIAQSLYSDHLMLLGDTPVLDGESNVIQMIDSPENAHRLIDQGVVKNGMALNLTAVSAAVKSMPTLKGHFVGFDAVLAYQLNGTGTGTMVQYTELGGTNGI